MKNNIFILKKKQRDKYKKIRKELSNKNSFIFNKKIVNNFFNKLKLKNIKVISSFFSIKSEIPTKELNDYIMKKKIKLTFPVVKFNTKILGFRLFKANQNLTEGKFGIPEPNEKNEELLPDLIFVPCLAFDNAGYRLGYGGGFYDHTLEYLKKINHEFISVGYAYDNQRADKVYRNKNDYKLNYILTEKKLYSFT